MDRGAYSGDGVGRSAQIGAVTGLSGAESQGAPGFDRRSSADLPTRPIQLGVHGRRVRPTPRVTPLSSPGPTGQLGSAGMVGGADGGPPRPGPAPRHAARGGPPPGSGRSGVLAKLLGRSSWNLLDQVLSTLTNAVLSVLVARSVDRFHAGAFATAFLLFSLLIAIERALVGQVVSIRHSAAGPREMRGVASRAMGTVAALGLPAGLLLAGAGLLLGGRLTGPLVAVGVTMAPLLMQDAGRLIFFAQARPQLAALNDAVWAVVQFSVMGVLIAGGWANTWSLILAWGGSAAVCVLLALIQLRAVPRVSAAPGWVREHRDLLVYLLPESLITSGGDKVAFLAIGRIVNLAAIGAVNVARQVLAPLLIISQAATSFAMPEIARRPRLSPRTRWYAGVGLAAVMVVATMAYVVALLLIPNVMGEWLFGDSWAGARRLLLPMGLFSAAAGACLGPFVVIAAMGHARRTLRIAMLQTVLTVTLMPLGAVFGGAPGAAWGLFAGKALEIPFWFFTLRTAAKDGPVPAAAGPDDERPDDERPNGAGLDRDGPVDDGPAAGPPDVAVLSVVADGPDGRDRLLDFARPIDAAPTGDPRPNPTPETLQSPAVGETRRSRRDRQPRSVP